MARIVVALKRRHIAAISLIELLISIAIISLLTAFALPGFRDLLDRFKVESATSEFRSAILLTRSEAIKRGVRIDLVPAVAHDWSRGWLVLIESNNNQQADADETVLHHSPGLPERLIIIASLRDGTKTYLAFDPSGRPRSAASSTLPQFGSFLLSVGSQQRKIVIGFLGRVRICDPVKSGAAC